MRAYLIAATTALVASPALAADTIPTPTPEPVPVYHSEMRGTTHVADGDWSGVYVKGQVGYVWPAIRGATYAVAGGTGIFATHDVDNTWTAGVGAGYQINRYLRTELMFDYIFDSDFTGSTFGGCGVLPAGPCVSTDLATWNAYSLIASVYVDLDFWGHGSAWGHFVPYVGGGIGGSYVNWSDLQNTSCEVADPTNCDPTIYHEGHGSWRFAWEVGAGGSYYFRCDFAAEAGYKYRRIEGGSFFGVAAGAGPGWDSGFSAHMVNAGLRYYPGRDCEPPYEPPVVPPVYK
ncbi:outer membrane protein [Hoeflea sp.]|uniref:outer membrane protein n=1 Tax=Hoeflea sp. TaxID=1940281 RepID=UPI003B010366